MKSMRDFKCHTSIIKCLLRYGIVPKRSVNCTTFKSLVGRQVYDVQKVNNQMIATE